MADEALRSHCFCWYTRIEKIAVIPRVQLSPASEGHCDAISLLMSNGASVSAVNEEGGTSLHLAAMFDHCDAIVLLLSKGASVNANYKATPSLLRKPTIVQTNHYANRTEFQQDNQNALLYSLLNISDRDKNLTIPCAMELISRGIEWSDAHTEQANQAIQQQDKNESVRHQQLAMLATIELWVKQREEGHKLTELPDEVYKRGADDVLTFFNSIKASSSLVYRKTLFVVGPSTWGKKSLIKSLTTRTSTLEDADHRTIGIDLFSWKFDNTTDTGERTTYDVSIWDLAGQDEYHSSNSLFYSKRTMYLVCVNLRAYKDMLDREGLMDRPGVVHPRMDAFVNHNIYRWIRAELIMADLMGRLKRKEVRKLKAIDQVRQKLREECRRSTSKEEDPTALRQQMAELDARYTRRPKYLSQRLVFASSADLSGIDDLRKVIEEAIHSCGTCFLMPDTYLNLNAYLKETVRDAEADITNGERIRETIVQSTELQHSCWLNRAYRCPTRLKLTTALHV
ncbi:hypothetical protein Poli38472_011705 [Pythium oligandrum]|uniref:Non-specific serine/threonine protein kinase n=1 Tax=Pythium oligandrum TaxID=41045 RepID=A0A8K1C7R6_PYTOL|nr:hypothetical protein Poli38472_011705 [Pythium oligandrum]|eukprot:TMW58117.1 hypothetical protein Poli38472_011705 [Pythium oligandrum]